MSLPKYFISCDWGTSNFRLKLIETDSLKVIIEYSTREGIQKLYHKFLRQQHLKQFDFFANYLLSQIKSFPKEHQNHIIVASGMISSNIGLQELAYVKMPFNTLDKSLISKKLALPNNLEMIMISGARNNFGMMRGEETQAIGLEEHLKGYKNGVLLLPGTHSKHLTFINRSFTDLKSFMTGELFEIISQKSILSKSIKKGDKSYISKDAFLKGVKLGAEGKLSSSLFSIRANHLLKASNEIDNYFFLSGLLIGDEISYLIESNEIIFLACPNPISHLYELALTSTMGADRYVVYGLDLVEKAVLLGQKKILTSYYD